MSHQYRITMFELCVFPHTFYAVIFLSVKFRGFRGYKMTQRLIAYGVQLTILGTTETTELHGKDSAGSAARPRAVQGRSAHGCRHFSSLRASVVNYFCFDPL